MLDPSSRRRVSFNLSLLSSIVVVLWLWACAPADEPQETAPAPAPAEAPAGEESTPPSYLAGTTLPPKFELPFTDYSNKTQPTSGFLRYDASDASQIRMQTWFEVCPPLPCVRREWIENGTPCSFYLLPDETMGHASYVVTEGLEPEEYALVGNMGPVWPDLVTRYHALLPEPPLSQPREGWFVPVPPPDNTMQWFLTSGVEGHPTTDPKSQGYFAFVVDPLVEQGGQYYKSPYGIGGTAPSEVGSNHGELVYDWQHWNLDPDFSPLTLPSLDGYQKFEGPLCPLCLPAENPPEACTGSPPPPPPTTPTPPQFNCPVCHQTTLSS
ncbi:MAG: hypothetical protein AAF657_04575 [Acidobacteriota bacterium]